MQDVFDKRDENVFKASTGLHGGIGGRRDVCGALLGSSMMLGLMYGFGTGEADNPKKKEVSTQMTSQLYKWLKKELGSVKCRTIFAKFQKEVNDDINTRGLAEPDKQARVFAKCDELAGRVAARTAEMLWDAIEAEKR